MAWMEARLPHTVAPPDAVPPGLSASEVRDRVATGRVNDVSRAPTRTVAEIVKANVFTRFNAILGALLLVIITIGPFQDALFGIVLVSNTLIGILQELRAKWALDRLALLNAPHASVVRDGAVTRIGVDQVVLDDMLLLGPGNQIPVDATVLAGDLEVDESLLTGESDPVHKGPGDEVLSGSFVVAGDGRVRAVRVGREAFAVALAEDARRFTLVRSELRTGIDLILRLVTYAIVPTAVLLITSQLQSSGVTDAIRGSVAGVGSMIPEGLVLLTSVAFAVAVVRLGRHGVLVQELPAVEGLARVDVVCVDKTGTITQGTIRVDHVEPLMAGAPIAEALGALAAADPHPNASLQAIGAAYPPPPWDMTARVPFSSARKWAAAAFDAHGTWVLGAPEVVCGVGGRGGGVGAGDSGSDSDGHGGGDGAGDSGGDSGGESGGGGGGGSGGDSDPACDDAGGQGSVASVRAMAARADALAGEGGRVVLIGHTDAPLEGEELPRFIRPVALVVLEEELRPDASTTVAYFGEQGVAVKVISGDHPRTVGAIARRVGVPGADAPVDGRQLPDSDDELADVLEAHSVFGRVTPQQKRAMVGALQRRGHVVAMTGDGVNDVLALKDADIGVAMGSGSDAARAVAQLVLLRGNFDVMPRVVGEGRRVIANIERVANLFVTKTVYAMLLALAVGVAGFPFPFLPRHLTIVSSLTIGIPAFFLALAPNAPRATSGFVGRVLRFAAPAGTVAAVATFTAYAMARVQPDVDLTEARTTATLVLFSVGMWVLAILARPLTGARRMLIIGLAVSFVGVLVVPGLREFFALDMPPFVIFVGAILVAVVADVALEAGWRLTAWLQRRADARRLLG